MNPTEPAAEVRTHQVSLFEDPISKLYETLDAIKEEEKMLKELEKDYPVELEELMEQAKEINDQVKERKEYFLKDLKENNDDWQAGERRRAELQISADELLAQVKELAIKQDGNLDLTIEANGTIVRLQTEATKEVFLDGKKV